MNETMAQQIAAQPSVVAKLRTFAKGGSPRMSQQMFEQIKDVFPGLLALASSPQSSSGWAGCVLVPQQGDAGSMADNAKTESCQAVANWLIERGLMEVSQPRAVDRRQYARNYVQRSERLGRKRLNLFIEPQVAKDLEFIARQKIQHAGLASYSQKSVVEEAIEHLAQVYRSQAQAGAAA